MDIMEISNRIDQYQADMIKDLQKLLTIRSVEGEGRGGRPFGEGPYQALRYMLELGSSMGFEIKNVDNYAGHIEYGNGDEIVGVLVHLDVVPEGEEPWNYPPYSGEVHEGKIYGRGAIDNKGPAIAALYGLKALKESNTHLKRKIRLILGTNEETGWGDIRYYLKKEKAPDLGFSPDAGFPVIHAEKGILTFELVKGFSHRDQVRIREGLVLKSIRGGTTPNMVADKCTAVIECKDGNSILEILDHYASEACCKFNTKSEGDFITIVAAGQSAHGAMPEKGINAISDMMLFLARIEFANHGVNQFLRFYEAHIGKEYNGQSIGCGFEDKDSGRLTFNVGLIDLDEERGKITVNVRYPVTVKGEEILNALRTKTEDQGIELVVVGEMKPKYLAKNHPLVETLMKVYRKRTGDCDCEPIAIGGGTYARAIENAVAFGPVFIGQESLEHQKDEYIEIDLLMKTAKIFADAMFELAVL